MLNRIARIIAAASFLSCGPASAWSQTELHYAYGKLDAPAFTGGATSRTHVFTLQNASGWEYADLFVFADFMTDGNDDGFNDSDVYSEAYLSIPLGKVFKTSLGFGPVRDIGLLTGVNFGANAGVRKFLPGVRFYGAGGGFHFINLDLAAYIDDNRGVYRGGAPQESNSYMLDVNWSYPVQIGSQSFSIVGHVEHIGNRTNEFGDKVSRWTLAQPQFRWDAGQAFFGSSGRFYLGIEWQFWKNKLGEPGANENRVQALAVIRL